jgi:hypothetical protein
VAGAAGALAAMVGADAAAMTVDQVPLHSGGTITGTHSVSMGNDVIRNPIRNPFFPLHNVVNVHFAWHVYLEIYFVSLSDCHLELGGPS